MRKFVMISISLMLGCFLLTTNVHAEYAQAGDKLIACDINGNNEGAVFSKATITISDVDLLGNYVYWGVDVGVFKKISDTQWQNVLVERLVMNGLTVQVDNFGPITSYEYDTVYALGFRVLYQTVGSESNPIIESQWKTVKDSSNQDTYFRVMYPVGVKFTDRVTAANSWISDNEEDIKKYNKYFPDSEVVCKVEIDPRGVDVEGYDITMDANDTDITDVSIEDLRVVKVEVGTGTGKKLAGDGNNAVYASAVGTPDTVSFSVTDTALRDQNNQPFPSRTGTNIVTVYFKYRFKNTPGIPEFTNRVTVKVKGSTREIEETNTIYIRSVKVNYM